MNVAGTTATTATAVTTVTAATTATTATPVDSTGASDIAALQSDATATPAPVAISNISAGIDIPSATVSLSAAAQAYLSQPDPPSIEETQRAKKKPKMKSLLEHMLEWSRKYEEQRDQQQKNKQLAASQGAAPATTALTTNSPKKTTPGLAIGGDTDAK